MLSWRILSSFIQPCSISHRTHIRGTMATPMPICTKRLMLSIVGISMDMFSRDKQSEFILQDFRGFQLRVARDERDGAEIEAIVQDFVRNVAGKHAVNADLDAGVQFAEFRERGQKSVDGAFV